MSYSATCVKVFERIIRRGDYDGLVPRDYLQSRGGATVPSRQSSSSGRPTGGAAATGEPRLLLGYACVHGKYYVDEPNGHRWERIAPHAFDTCLKSGGDIVALIEHDGSRVVGSTAHNLRLTSDVVGLQVVLDASGVTGAGEIVRAARTGRAGMSFSGHAVKAHWERTYIGQVYVVDEIALKSVTFCFDHEPANSATCYFLATDLAKLNSDSSHIRSRQGQADSDLHRARARLIDLSHQLCGVK
jgi:HK97 family phage prohead protease